MCFKVNLICRSRRESFIYFECSGRFVYDWRLSFSSVSAVEQFFNQRIIKTSEADFYDFSFSSFMNSYSHDSFFGRDRPGGEFLALSSQLNVYAKQTFIPSWDVNHLTSASLARNQTISKERDDLYKWNYVKHKQFKDLLEPHKKKRKKFEWNICQISHYDVYKRRSLDSAYWFPVAAVPFNFGFRPKTRRKTPTERWKRQRSVNLPWKPWRNVYAEVVENKTSLCVPLTSRKCFEFLSRRILIEPKRRNL